MTHLILHSNYHGHIELLYSSRRGASGNISSILFMERIHKLFERDRHQRRHHYTLYCTDPITPHQKPLTWEKYLNIIREWSGGVHHVRDHQTIELRRFQGKDLETALGPIAERKSVVAYVCGPPPMTDWAVDVLQRSEGMDQKRVLCEKWW